MKKEHSNNLHYFIINFILVITIILLILSLVVSHKKENTNIFTKVESYPTYTQQELDNILHKYNNTFIKSNIYSPIDTKVISCNYKINENKYYNKNYLQLKK